MNQAEQVIPGPNAAGEWPLIAWPHKRGVRLHAVEQIGRTTATLCGLWIAKEAGAYVFGAHGTPDCRSCAIAAAERVERRMRHRRGWGYGGNTAALPAAERPPRYTRSVARREERHDDERS